jgi:dTDP-4-dehydrorhamnose 3,5-epimerase
LWNDPAIGIDWPVKTPILSAKDAQGRSLHDAFIPG